MTELLASIITTAPRPTETLTFSIKSMREAGFVDERLNIMADGISDHELPQLPLLKFIHPPEYWLGGLKAWVYALRYLVENTEAPWLMVCEDDIVWTRNCKAQLELELHAATAAKNVGYISLYAARAVTWHLAKYNPTAGTGMLAPGYYESKLGWSTWGSQCLILPRDTAKKLLAHMPFRRFVESHMKNKNRDAIVSKFLSEMKLRTMFRIPCLVNHIGAGNSALGNSPKKALETDYFVEAL